MELNELLEQHNVESLEQALEKIKNSAQAEALKSFEEQKAGLKKQITDLETIKASQGDEVGTMRKDLKEAKEKLEALSKDSGANKSDNASLPEKSVKTEDDWARENKSREASFTDAEWDKLDKALASTDPAIKKLVSSEEGRAAFMNEILGQPNQQTQATFRRQVQKEQLSIEEQIKQALGRGNVKPVSQRQPAGTAFDPNRQAPESRTPAINPHRRSGSALDLLKTVQK